MNLKIFQAGKRARCPDCAGRFRVPNESREYSLPLEEEEAEFASAKPVKNVRSLGSKESFELREPTEPVHGATGRVVPKAVAEAPQAVWYVRPPSGGQYGPADANVFLQWIQENRISRDAYVWRDGWPQWMLAAEAFEEYFGSNWVVEESRLLSDSGSQNDSANFGADSSDPTVTSDLNSTRGPVPRVRRNPRQSNQALVIGILAFLAVGLLVVLIAVLKMQ